MDSKVFAGLCAIARDGAGINLKEGKEALVSARVGKRLRKLGLSNEGAYLEYLRADTTGKEFMCFVDVISTNFTNFMREPEHFEMLAEIAAQHHAKRRASFRLWCAAAATGEEPYSLAITLENTLGARGVDYRILATDISTTALNTAVAGRYDEKTIAPLPRAHREKYLLRERANGDGATSTYTVCSALKERIVFRRLNLAKPPFPMRGPLNVVFCRNVMIYFDRDVRQGLISEAERLLAPGGTLFTGHSESLSGIRTKLQAIKPSVYRKPAN